MVVATVDDIVAALPSAQVFPVDKASIANMLAGGFASLWRATGVPTQGAIPGAAAIPTKSTTGSLLNFTNAGGSDGLYLARANWNVANAATTLMLVDRLAHMGGLSGTSTSAQTVNVSITSLEGGRVLADLSLDSAVRWWLEIYTDIGTTGVNATVSYTRDSDGTAGRTVVIPFAGASPANRAGRIFEIVPIAGEVIRSVESVQLSATTGTAGSFGVTATKHLADFSLEAAIAGKDYHWGHTGLPEIADDACLALLMVCGTTSTGIVRGSGRLITT